jgi:hypothetical protein
MFGTISTEQLEEVDNLTKQTHMDVMIHRCREVLPITLADSDTIRVFKEVFEMYGDAGLVDTIRMVRESAFSGRTIENFITAANANTPMQYYLIHNPDGTTDYAGRIKPDDSTNVYQLFDATKEFKLQLSKYGRRFFDVFARGALYEYKTKDGQILQLSIGQVNYYSWMRRYHVLSYITENLDMLKTIRTESRKRRKCGMVRPK